jgi:hypothetical protein
MSNNDQRYQQHARIGRKSFKAFERDWNSEVSCCFQLWSRQGDQEITQICYKTKLLLEQYHGKLEQLASLRGVLPTDDEHCNNLDSRLRDNRNSLRPTQLAENTVPVHSMGRMESHPLATRQY